jgi:GDP/UDP-N,N'-diacetylbacillosamine 2-epimerase (hydrolysing)
LSNNKRVFFIENFGTKGYFTCMKYCAFLLGNTSSGIIEAASFSKYVINLGERQKGRAKGENVFDCDFDIQHILTLAKKIGTLPLYNGHNIYWNGGAVEKTIKTLKECKL